MAERIALLKGINVGRAKRIAMADLRALLTDLGYTKVRTLLQSGNAVFDAGSARPEKIEKDLRAAIRQAHGFDVVCLVITAARLRALIEANPFPERTSEGSKYLLSFLSRMPSAAELKRHDPISPDPDNARLGEQVIYQWCPDGILDAPQLGTFAERQFGITVTARNWNTIVKLEALTSQ